MRQTAFDWNLPPGMFVDFASVDELKAFEDMVALAVEPRMNADNYQDWQKRDPVKNVIKPEDHISSIAEIALEVMDNPFEYLSSVEDRGYRFQKGHNTRLKSQNEVNLERTRELSRGFFLSAVAQSVSRTRSGHVYGEMYYVPAVLSRGRRIGESPVRRIATIPLKTPEIVRPIAAQARRIGFSALRSAAPLAPQPVAKE
jgi:hypothetical protein